MIITNSHILWENSIKKRKHQNSTQRLDLSPWTAGGREGPVELPRPDHSLTRESGRCLWWSPTLGFLAHLLLPDMRWFWQSNEESTVCSHHLLTPEPSSLCRSLLISFQMWNPKRLSPPGTETHSPGCSHLPSTPYPSLDLIPSIHPPMECGSDAPVARPQSEQLGDPLR